LDIGLTMPGWALRMARHWASTPSVFELVVRTNILVTYFGSRVALGQFHAAPCGQADQLDWRGANQPVPLQNAYASSKAWVRSFTKTLGS